MVDQVLVDTLGRCLNELGTHISPTQGSWADVNLLKIDMKYIDINGSLKCLYAMARSTDGLEAKPWSFPALFLSLSILSLKVLDFRNADPIFQFF